MLTQHESEIVKLCEENGIEVNRFYFHTLCRIIRKLECQNARWRHAWEKHDELEAEEQTASE